MPVVDDIRPGQMGAELLCHLGGTFLTVDLRQQDHELVSAIATGRVRAPDAEEQACRRAVIAQQDTGSGYSQYAPIRAICSLNRRIHDRCRH